MKNINKYYISALTLVVIFILIFIITLILESMKCNVSFDWLSLVIILSIFYLPAILFLNTIKNYFKGSVKWASKKLIFSMLIVFVGLFIFEIFFSYISIESMINVIGDKDYCIHNFSNF